MENDGASFPAAVLKGQAPAMRAGSSGLGLAFADLIARRHATPAGRHGSIELSNVMPAHPASGRASTGARFSLILP